MYRRMYEGTSPPLGISHNINTNKTSKKIRVFQVKALKKNKEKKKKRKTGGVVCSKPFAF